MRSTNPRFTYLLIYLLTSQLTKSHTHVQPVDWQHP